MSTRRHRCAALDKDGFRCKKYKGTKRTSYHGDGEIYDAFSDKPQWVEVWFCDDHSVD